MAAICNASLRDRISLLVVAMASALTVLAGAWWVQTTRNGIHEEIEAGTHVAEQWLGAMTRSPENATPAQVLAMLAAVGHVRANMLQAQDPTGRLLYRSPPATYKAGRAAPDWLSALLDPHLPGRSIMAGDLRLNLQPDASRAVLDAWDDLVQMAGWSACLVFGLGLAIRHALTRALAPLAALDGALARSAGGDHDTRLARHGVTELDRLADSYNRLAEKLDRTLVRNARLEYDQSFVQAVNDRLEDERRMLARELHDELGQGITAVRAIAGAIVQRSTDQPALHGNAQAILAMTGQMQDGVRNILDHLRQTGPRPGSALSDAVAGYCAHWAGLYPHLHLSPHIANIEHALDERYCAAVLRLLQESLTNVARHAHARQVDVHLSSSADGVRLRVADDGCGLAPDELHETTDRRDDGAPRYGLIGMRERAAQWGGTIAIEPAPSGGTCVYAMLPWPGHDTFREDTLCPHPR